MLIISLYWPSLFGLPALAPTSFRAHIISYSPALPGQGVLAGVWSYLCSPLSCLGWAGLGWAEEHGNQFQHKTPDLRHTIHAVSVLEGVEQCLPGQ